MSASKRPYRAAAASGGAFHALVPAAGRGERFGGEVPKQFLEVAGRPLLVWTVERLLAAGATSVVVALPDDFLDRAGALHQLGETVRFVAGGATRQASVAEALAASPAVAGELVAVHDGARAAVDPRDVAATVAAARAADGAVLGRAVTDTIKRGPGRPRRRHARPRAPLPRRDAAGLPPRVARARRSSRRVSTVSWAPTRRSLVERLGRLDLRAVEAQRPNPKITYPEDVALIGRLFAAEEWR